MEEKQLLFEDAPWEYPLCFNSECKLCDTCMHYQVGLLAPANRQSGHAIYPSAWKDGDCRFYREKRLVQYAWGFDGLYKGLTKGQATDIRSNLRVHLSSGMSTYYRYHHGQRLLTPQQQKEILEICDHFAPDNESKFDHYVTSYDFS